MDTINGIKKMIESETTNRFKGKIFKSEYEIQQEFNKIWYEAMVKLREIIPTNKYYIVEAINTAPSVVQYVSTEKERVIKFFIINLVCRNKDYSLYKCKVDTTPIGKLTNNILDSVERAVKDISSGDHGGDQPLSNKIKPFLKIYQRCISDLYDCEDEHRAKQIIKVIHQGLYGLGYEVIEYESEINEHLFDVRFEEDCDTVNIVSPTIRNRANGEIELKGIVYHP